LVSTLQPRGNDWVKTAGERTVVDPAASRKFSGIIVGMEHVPLATLHSGLAIIGDSPSDCGRVELIVRRPSENEREVLSKAELSTVEGLVGDCWSTRGSSATEDGSANPKAQITLMNARAAALVAGSPDRRRLAGDQLFVDLDLSAEGLPPGTRLAVGSAVIEVTDFPHRGCRKFSARFGVDALKFVNSEQGRKLNLRGINARVVVGGLVRTGDVVARVAT
jgi:hypothetical protein